MSAWTDIMDLESKEAAPRTYTVNGAITLPDGSVTNFAVDGETYSQWGQPTAKLGQTVGIMEAIEVAVARQNELDA